VRAGSLSDAFINYRWVHRLERWTTTSRRTHTPVCAGNCALDEGSRRHPSNVLLDGRAGDGRDDYAIAVSGKGDANV
jgi:hypothetical protein